MIEDVENPENNTCFVLVGIRSSDSKIDLSDLPSKYFEMGKNITCGSWVDEDKIEQRILDAKKKNRTLATVGGALGGAALGVGSMELFGNRLIGGELMGQKEGSRTEQFYTYVGLMESGDRQNLKNYVSTMATECAKWQDSYGQKPSECNGLDIGGNTVIAYEEILQHI